MSAFFGHLYPLLECLLLVVEQVVSIYPSKIPMHVDLGPIKLLEDEDDDNETVLSIMQDLGPPVWFFHPGIMVRKHCRRSLSHPVIHN